MARPRRIDSDLVGKAQEIAAVAKDLHILRGAQAVLLPALLNATLEQTATLLGVSRATVPRLQNELRHRCVQPGIAASSRGGRRHELMTPEEEREFLAPGAQLASAGNILVVSPLRAALSQKLGRTVEHPWYIGFWNGMVGARWHPARGIPKAMHKHRKTGKKTARKLGCHRQTRSCERSAHTSDVSGRGAFRAHGAHSQMLGTRTRASGGHNGYEREFVYVYGAPLQGDLDWMICRQMNTSRMSEFLVQVSEAHRNDFIIMVVDGASSHVSKDLAVPKNVRLIRLPPYASELNPQEHIWDELRKKEFPNRVFADLAGVTRQLESGLPKLAANTEFVRSITAWPWIICLNLNAH